MKFTVYPDYPTLSSAIADQICALVEEKPDCQICIAAGHSSLGIFNALIELYQCKKLDFSHAYFAAMDEWLGMNSSTPGSCGDFLNKHFLSKVNFPESHISLADGMAADLDAECTRMKEFISLHGGLDYILLGVGMNGHLALNEPGSDFSQSVHLTQLDSVTKQVGTKYFADSPTLTGGITIGIGDISKARQAVLSVNGSGKREILKRIMESPITPDLPATALKEMDHALILCDSAAAELISFS